MTLRYDSKFLRKFSTLDSFGGNQWHLSSPWILTVSGKSHKHAGTIDEMIWPMFNK